MGGALAGAGSLLGGIARSQKDKSDSRSTTSNVSYLEAAPETEEEKRARSLAFDSLTSLDARLKSIEASPALSRLDSLLAELGKAPSAERINEATQFANSMFATQEQSLTAAFSDQASAAAQRAAQMGRSSADPILAAKLAQEQVRQRAALDAQKTAFSADYANNSAANQFGNLLQGVSGLSQQAIANRQAVFSLGSDFANTLQQYRLATGKQYGQGVGTMATSSGGGMKGAITGALGGAAGGVSMGQGMRFFKPTT